MTIPADNAVALVDYDCQCSLGTNLDDAWQRLTRDESGVGLVDRIDIAAEKLFGVSDAVYGGQIPATFAELAGSEARLNKWVEPSVHVLPALFGRIRERLRFDVAEHDPTRVGVIGGTALTSSVAQEIVHQTGKPRPNSMLCQCQNIPLSALAIEHGLQGPLFSIGSACASSGHALLIASQLIQSGCIDCAVVCGFEFPFVPVCIGGFVWLNAVYRRDNPTDRAYDDAAQASRPFSADRRGFLLAEGAGVALVSRVGYARQHAWPLKCVLRGGAMNSDAAGMTKISQTSIERCMTDALAAAKTDVDEVDCINAHGTSTPLGDGVELHGLKSVFGDRLEQVPLVANKSQIGHSLGATSIIEIILAAEGMRTSTILPTLNHTPDPELPLACIPTATRQTAHDVVLVNAFGFGGTNVSLVLERGCD